MKICDKIKKMKIEKDKYSLNYLLVDRKEYIEWKGTKKEVRDKKKYLIKKYKC